MHRRRDSKRARPQWRQRYDRGELLAPVERPDGTLLVEGFACREGILEYQDETGNVWRELVPLSTLDSSAAGLARLAVTLEHPEVDVSPENYEELGVGDTDGIVRVEEGGFVRVSIAVRKADAIREVKQGKRELSPGYLARIENTPGTHPVYGPYDAVQVERRYNHLAIVDVARGGPEIRLRADGAGRARTVIRRDNRGTPPPTTPARPRMNVNSGLIALLVSLGISQRCDSDDAAIAAINATLQQRKDAADKAANDHKAALAALEKERDDEKKRADKAEAKVAELEKAKRDAEEEELMKELDALAERLKVDKAKFASDNAGYQKAIASAYIGGGKIADSEVAGILAVARKAAKDAESEEQPSEDEDMPVDEEEEEMVDEGEEEPKDDSVTAARRRGRRAWHSTMVHDRDTRRTHSRADADDEPLSSSDLYAQHSRKAFEAARGRGRE